MEFLNYILIFLYAALSACGLLYFNRYKRVNPVFWFIIFQSIMAVGTIFVADLGRDSDQLYVILFFVAKLVYLFTAICFWEASGIRSRYKQFWLKALEYDSMLSRVNLKIIVMMSVLVVFLYYAAIGYNLFLNILFGIVVDDFSTMRLATYSGDNYYAPGFVNQFKNVLLPVGISILAGWAWFRGGKFKFVMLVVIGGGFTIVALLGTGQRAFLAYSLVALLFGLSAITKLKFKYSVLPIAIVVILFSYMTSVYKSHLIEDGSNIYIGSLSKSIERFMVTEQSGALGAFRYIYTLDTVYFKEWKDQFAGIIPGHKGSTLQHDLFYLVHGTDRGTEGYAVLTGFYYNGGIATIIIGYALLALFHSSMFYRFLNGRKTIFRVFNYAALFFYLSIFVSGGPITMVNNGIVTLLILLFVRKISVGTYRLYHNIPCRGMGVAHER